MCVQRHRQTIRELAGELDEGYNTTASVLSVPKILIDDEMQSRVRLLINDLRKLYNA